MIDTNVAAYRSASLTKMLRDAGLEARDIPDEVADDALRAMMQNDADVAFNIIVNWIGGRNEQLERDRSRARRIREDQQSFRKARTRHGRRPQEAPAWQRGLRQPKQFRWRETRPLPGYTPS